MKPEARFDRGELKAVGRRLRLRRVAKGWSLKRLSDMSGISIAAIRKVELGESNPSLLTLLALVEALDEPVDRLIAEVLERGERIQVVRSEHGTGTASGSTVAPAEQLLSDSLQSPKMAGRRVMLEPGQLLEPRESMERPLFAYVLDGEVRVSRIDGPEDSCRQGDAFHIFHPSRDRVYGAAAGASLIVVENTDEARLDHQRAGRNN